MKLIVLAVAALAAAPLAAQTADHSGHQGHATASAALSLDTPIESLMADAKGKAAVEAVLPGVEAHPAYGQFKAMSLRQVQPFSQGMITDEMLAKIEAALKAG